MGVRITPDDRMAVHTADRFYMQSTSAESNVLNVTASLADILVGNEEDFQLCLGFAGPEADGQEVYFIPNPTLGLWIDGERF